MSCRFEFSTQCHDCPLRAQCLGKEQRHRSLVVGEYHTVLQARQQEQQTPAFQQRMVHRNAIEGTQSELVRAHGLRRQQGPPEAQAALGVCFHNGQGVKQDSAQAMKWWRKAAEQGFAEAQYNLAVGHLRGDGVGRNLVEAHKWFALAEAQGEKDAQEGRSKAERLMMPDEIAEAKRLAEEFKPTPPVRPTG